MKSYYPLFLMVSLLLWPMIHHAQKLDYYVAPTHINKIVAIEDNIWMCTNSGVVQLNLDGERIKHHHFRDGFEVGLSDIDYLGKDKNGILYARCISSSEEGNIVYRKHGDQWERSKKYSQPHILLLPFGDKCFGYYDHKKKMIFIEIGNGWIKKKMTLEEGYNGLDYLSLNSLFESAFFFREEEKLWLIGGGEIFCLSEEGTLRKYNLTKDAIDDGLISEYCKGSSMHILLRNIISEESYYYIYDSSQDTFVLDSLEGNQIANIFVDEQQRIYKVDEIAERVGVSDSGTDYIFNRPTENWSVWGIGEYIVDGVVDKNNTIWLATFNGNVYRSEKDSFHYISMIDRVDCNRQRQFCQGNRLVSKRGRVLLTSQSLWDGDGVLLNAESIAKNTFSLQKYTDKEKLFFAIAMPSITQMEEPLDTILNHISTTYDLDEILGDREVLIDAYYDRHRECIILCNKKGRCRIFSPEGIIGDKMCANPQDMYSLEWEIFGHRLYNSYTASLWIYNFADFYKISIEGDTITTTNFDSTSFPVEEEVRGIYEDKQHQIWVQTQKAVYLYKGNQWTRFDQKALGLKKKKLPFRATFREDEFGNLLLLTEQGIIKWDGHQWSMELQWKGDIKKAKPTKFWLDDNNTIWVAGLYKGVYTINRKNPKQVTLISSTLDIEDWAKEKKTGVVWLLLTYGEGVCKYTP